MSLVGHLDLDEVVDVALLELVAINEGRRRAATATNCVTLDLKRACDQSLQCLDNLKILRTAHVQAVCHFADAVDKLGSPSNILADLGSHQTTLIDRAEGFLSSSDAFFS